MAAGIGVNLATAYIDLVVGTSNLAKSVKTDLAGVDRQVSDTGQKAGTKFTDGFKRKLKVGAAIGGALLAAGATKYLSGAITEASDLNESLNAVDVTFGKNAGGIKKLGEEAAGALGLSNTQFNGLAVQFGSFATTIAGKGGDVVGTMEELTGRGSDFASVMNLDVNEAMRIFQSGLAGETEPLRKYGIDLSAAAVENHALAEGIHDGNGQMTEAQKVQARYSLLMAATSKTQGDFANTSGGLANSQRILSANWDNMKAKVGSALVPILEKLSGWVVNTGLPALERLGGFLAGKLGPVFTNVKDSVGGFVEQFKAGEGAGGGLRTALNGIRGAAAAAFGYIKDTAIPAFQGFIAEFRNGEGAGGKLRDILTGVWNAAKTAFGWIRDEGLPALMALGRFIMERLWPDIKAAFVDRIIPAVVEMGRVIQNFWVNFAQPALSKLWVFIRDILAPFLVDFYENGVKPTFDLIGKVISKTFAWVRDTGWPWMRDALAWIGEKASWLWTKHIKPAFDNIKDKASTVFSWIKDKGWPWLRDALELMGKKASWLYKDHIKPAFDNIKSAISGAWTGVKKIFSSFRGGLDTLGDRFRTVKDGIASAWAAVVTAVGTPIVATIKWVNDNFLAKVESALNKIPGVDITLGRITVPSLPTPPPTSRQGDTGARGRIGGMATGGPVPGWSPHDRADNIPAMLTAGEYVLPVRAVDRLRSRFGAGFLELLRKGLPGYFSGGPVASYPLQKNIRDTRELLVTDKAPLFSVGSAAAAWNGITDLLLKVGPGATIGPSASSLVTEGIFGPDKANVNGWAYQSTGLVGLNSRPGRSAAERRATAVHELGHVLGMGHSALSSIMSSSADQDRNPTANDRAWLRSMYPPIPTAGRDDSAKRPTGAGKVGTTTGGWFNLPNPIKWIKDKITELLSGIGSSWPSQGALGALKSAGSQAVDWVKGKLFGAGGVAPGARSFGGLTSAQIGALVKSVVSSAKMTSGYRPGSVTASGYISGHALNEAADFVSANMLNDFNRVKDIRSWREAYYSPAGSGQRKYGQPYNTKGTPAYGDHFDHFHLRAAEGGLVPKVYDSGGILPPGGAGINLSSKPELVLTQDQVARMGGPSVVYVENPWTGEYHEARMRGVADDSVTQASRRRTNFAGAGAR